MRSAQQILDAVKQQYGIAFTEVHTGGGCMALEARLESGHWIVATDENLTGFRDRFDLEDIDQLPYGWSIGIYLNNTAHGDDWWGGGEDAVVDVVDYDAWAHDLPAMIGAALKALTGF